MLKLKEYRGFTLVEVILVVLILGVLAAIVLPRITSSRDDARLAAADANVAAVNAMLEYAYIKDGEAYPADLAGLCTFAACTTYFPEGVDMAATGYNFTYCTTTNRAGHD